MRAWFESKENEFVGIARNGACCPVYLYLKDNGVGNIRRVNTTDILIDGETHWITLPIRDWTKNLIISIDRNKGSDITGSDALLIMDTLCLK